MKSLPTILRSPLSLNPKITKEQALSSLNTRHVHADVKPGLELRVEDFFFKLAKARKLVGPKTELVPRLDYGFTNRKEDTHGQMGLLKDRDGLELMDIFGIRKTDEIVKDINYYWPKNGAGKPLAYLGYVKAGWFPHMLHQLIGAPMQWVGMASPLGLDGNLRGFETSPTEATYYFWADDQPRIGGDPLPDCFVHVDYERMDYTDFTIKYKAEQLEGFDYDLYKATLAPFLQVETSVKPPIGYLGSPELKFDVEGEVSDRVRDKIEDEPIFDRANNREFSLFGAHRSQQEPHRWLSPNPLPIGPRALVPLLNFNDKDDDMTYQYLADLCAYDKYGIKHFCKIDASCT